jgi:hypothetical protein
LARVKVNKIVSVTDPITGMPAKQIELVQVRDARPQDFYAGEEAKVIQNIVNQLQSMGFMPQFREVAFAKLTMVLTEMEYDMLGIRLDVNDVYELEIKNGSLTFKKYAEGT